ncbi:MAG: hypothetical protein ABIN97_14555 [Ginsengibacter sp.]
MKNLFCVFILIFFSSQLLAQKQKAKQTASSASEIKVSLSPEHWDFQEGKVEFLEYKGLKAIRLNENSGSMIYKDLNFINGTIEFDVEVNQPQPFATIYFRWQNKDEAEHVYLRTGTALRKNAFDAVQYASIIKGVNIWDLQHEFQSGADIKIAEWNHVKLIVSGKQLRVYVNNGAGPNLEIPCLEGNTPEGKIGIGTGFPGQAVFANLIVKPNETAGLSEQPGADLTKHDTRYIRTWQVSKTDSLPYGTEVNGFMLPKADIAWQNIDAERRGLVNLSRKFGSSGYRQFVWLQAKIKSEFNQVQELKMGFSDEIWVFINQRPVYVDKNIYYQNMRKSPNGRISLDNCSFQLPLVKGDNQLLIAVANDFYGWGIMARLENLDGIELIR